MFDPDNAPRLKLVVTPKRAGIFRVRVRAWVTNDYVSIPRDPSSGSLDQQGWATYETAVTVSEPDGVPPSWKASREIGRVTLFSNNYVIRGFLNDTKVLIFQANQNTEQLVKKTMPSCPPSCCVTV